MLRTLLESQPTAPRRAGGTVVSIGAHSAMIALAIAATARATAVPSAPREIIDPVRFQPPAVQRDIAAPSHPHVVDTAVPPWPTQVLLPPLHVPTTFPAIDVSRPTTDQRDFTGQPVSLGKELCCGARSGLSSGGRDIFTTETVDRAAMPRPGNPTPVYPPSLRSADVEGSVVARFVVDTSGRAEPQSITFPEATHPLFAEAVRQSLLRSRYLPARIGSRPVRQLVEQRFAFTLGQ